MVKATHDAYFSAGDYEVKVRVKDVVGNIASRSIAMKVEERPVSAAEYGWFGSGFGTVEVFMMF